jgi:hypothetical protein
MPLEININKKIQLISFSIFIFFFDFLRDYIDLRILIFIPFFFAIYEFIPKSLKLDSKIAFIFFLIFVFLIWQGQSNEMFFTDRIYNLKSIIFLFITVFTIWHFSDLILDNIDLVINFFLIFFLCYSLFFELYRYELHGYYKQCHIGCYSIIDDKLEFFKENSHIGFISSLIINYHILKIKKIDFYFFSFLMIIIFISLNFSLTIFAGTISILSYFLLFYFKKFNLYQILAIILVIFSTSFGLIKNSSQVDKLANLIKFDNWNIQEKKITLADDSVKLNNQKNKVKELDLITKENKTAKKENKTAKKENKTDRKENKTAKKENKTAKKENKTDRKENKTDRKESLILDVISKIVKPSERNGQSGTNMLNIIPNLKKKIDEKDLTLDKKFKEKIKKSSVDTSKKPKNLSSEVYIVSLNIAKFSFFENPLGFGLNNYHLAFRNFINEVIVTNKMTQKLNFMDGSNNFSKLIAEFGIFSIIIFYIIFNFLFSKKISFEYKFLIFPPLFAQTFIRGAGYFNGGWILFLVLAFYLIYKSKE